MDGLPDWMHALDRDLESSSAVQWAEHLRRLHPDRATLAAALDQVPYEILPALLDTLGGDPAGGEG